MPAVLQDLRLAIRTWRRKPWMAALLVATLAIGLSGTIVVFSLADLALWHPLPFRQPDRLVSLWSYLPRQHTTAPTIRLAALDGWAARERLFSAVYVYGTGGFTVSGHGEPSALTGAPGPSQRRVS